MANADKPTTALENKGIQQHLLGVAPTATEEYLAVKRSDQAFIAVSVKQVGSILKVSVLKASPLAMTGSVAQRTALWQQVLARVEQKPAREPLS